MWSLFIIGFLITFIGLSILIGFWVTFIITLILLGIGIMGYVSDKL
jgi:hypothetical protein